jgi:hypothetical protein
MALQLTGKHVLLLLALPFLLPSFTAAQGTKAASVETIVMLRHGEKPEAGLGQINCQGLNRALALPAVIEKQFGKPDAIFAPDPSDRTKDDGKYYDYIRPLATIEPTAVRFGLPVDTSFGLTDIDGLREAIDRPDNRSALILVAWEHKQIQELARDFMRAHGGDPDSVPKWQGKDFDSLYVIRIDHSKPAGTATFEKSSEGLNGQLETCPQ